MTKRGKKGLYLFVYGMLIIAILDIVKYVWVNVQSVAIAFTVENSSGEQIFSLSNFQRLFAEFAAPDSGQIIYLKNTFRYFFMYLIKTGVAFAVAYFFYKKITGYKFFRIVFYLPCIISPIVLVMSYIDILRVEGPLWVIIKSVFGTEYSNLLGSVKTATPTILAFCIWSGFGTSLLIFVGAMNRIPESIIEAGELDGCNMWTEFFKVVLPLTWETFSTMMLLTVIALFTATGPILYFTAGAYETSTISFWIFNEVLGGTYNYPAAVGLFFTVIAIPVVWLVKFIMDKFNAQISY